jgi:hypothetical protein
MRKQAEETKEIINESSDVGSQRREAACGRHYDRDINEKTKQTRRTSPSRTYRLTYNWRANYENTNAKAFVRANEKNIQYGVLLPCIQKEAMILMGTLYEVQARFGRNGTAPIQTHEKRLNKKGEGEKTNRNGEGG